MTALEVASPDRARRFLRRHAALIAMPALVALFLAVTVAIHPSFGAFDVQSLALGALPLALAAAAQTVVVLSGGIDLSVGSLMAVFNVLSARTMQHADFGQSLGLAALILLVGALAGAANGAILVLSRVPDVVVTLATGFIWGGVALLILEQPGGGAPPEFLDLATGTCARAVAAQRAPAPGDRPGGGLAASAREPARPDPLRHGQRSHGGVPQRR